MRDIDKTERLEQQRKERELRNQQALEVSEENVRKKKITLIKFELLIFIF